MRDVRLELSSVSHDTDHLHVRELSCEVRAGEALAVLGPPHSGKTDLLMLCAGAVPPQHGRVRILDQVPHHLPAPEQVRLQSQIAFLQETP
ncbi:MAG: ATP-binding cassette domain-containing protein, partial [Planctomycetota bacterium]